MAPPWLHGVMSRDRVEGATTALHPAPPCAIIPGAAPCAYAPPHPGRWGAQAPGGGSLTRSAVALLVMKTKCARLGLARAWRILYRLHARTPSLRRRRRLAAAWGYGSQPPRRHAGHRGHGVGVLRGAGGAESFIYSFSRVESQSVLKEKVLGQTEVARVVAVGHVRPGVVRSI